MKSSFKSSGHTLGIRNIDSGKDESILLLHGFNDTKETFIFLEEFLLSRFNLFSFDFRGHGDSDWKTSGFYNSQESLLDIHNFIETFLKEKKFHVLAHSMGAGLASRYVGFYPENVQSLILLEGFSGLQAQDIDATRIRNWMDTHAKKNSKQKISERRESKKEDLEKKLGFIYSKLDKEKVKTLCSFLIEETDSNLYRWKNDPNLKTGSPIPFPPELSRYLWRNIQCPILLLFGEDTHLMPTHLDEIKSHFNKLEFHTIKNAGHNMQHDQPEILIELMKDFLERHV